MIRHNLSPELPAPGSLQAMAVHLPDVAGHPNRAPFRGVLTLVDVPSTKPPSGARGHRVVLTRAAALAALPSLLGMAVDYVPSWDGHDARRKCGIITHADVDGARLRVAGYLYAKDFPEVERQLRHSSAGAMGMSWELADAHVADMNAAVWSLTRATFTGAAILLREKAAYRDTSFELTPDAPRCRTFTAGAHNPLRARAASRARTLRKEATWNCRQEKAWAR
ncbi:MAG TPA: hypothetical protein VME68_12420 [Acidobacteriaceae bacterium]|nr:hypothetical protein [Acidobacteriaceae bacterium]